MICSYNMDSDILWKYLQSGCIGRDCFLVEKWAVCESTLPKNISYKEPVVIFVLTKQKHWIVFYTGYHKYYLSYSYNLMLFDPLCQDPYDYGLNIGRFYDDNFGQIHLKVSYPCSLENSAYWCLFFVWKKFGSMTRSVSDVMSEMGRKSEGEIVTEIRGPTWFGDLFETTSLTGPFHKIDLGIDNLYHIKLHEEDNKGEEELELVNVHTVDMNDLMPAHHISHEDLHFEMLLHWVGKVLSELVLLFLTRCQSEQQNLPSEGTRQM